MTLPQVHDSRRARFRYLPAGCIFDQKIEAVFLEDEDALFGLMACLNSSVSNLAMLAMTPERTWTTGQVSFIPVFPDALKSVRLQLAAREAHDVLLAWDAGHETSSRFVRPHVLQAAFPVPDRPETGHPLAKKFSWPKWESWLQISALQGSPELSLLDLLAVVRTRRELLAKRIEALETEVDDEVFRCYGLDAEAEEIRRILDHRLGLTIEDETEGAEPSAKDAEEEGQKEAAEERSQEEGNKEDLDELYLLLSYYAKRAIESLPHALVPLDPRVPDNLFTRVRDLLRSDWGEERTAHLGDEIHDLLGMSLEDWLTHEFFPFHVRLYKNRPIFWLLWSASRGRGRGRRGPAFACFIDYRRLTADTLRVVRGRLLARTLDQVRAQADRLEREATEARIAEERRAAHLLRDAEEAQAKVGELERFDRALADLLERHEPPELRADASWRERMVAAVRADGYTPDLDLGVLVNITPLREAGVLHPAAERVR